MMIEETKLNGPSVIEPSTARAPMDIHFSSRTVECSTPQPLFDLLNGEFNFTVDVCASPENAKCARFYTAEQDGLKQDWSGEVVWCNPPFQRQIGKWIKKAYESAHAGATVVCLVPARTDSPWFHDYALHGEVRFLRGRVKFGGAEKGAPFPSMIIVFRARVPYPIWNRSPLQRLRQSVDVRRLR